MMNGKKITQAELNNFLKKHKLWLINDPKGERANLRGANLRGANLRGANLRGADLERANLRCANLRCADIRGADLRGANLERANLRGANLWGANLERANLRCADIRGANLRGANLRGADLERANLRGANLRGANLDGANLRGANLDGADLWGANLWGADLWGAKNVNYPIACPEKGSFTAFKKADGYIVELLIPEDAKRCSATSRKCRCNKANVISITTLAGEDSGMTSVCSSYDKDFIYTVGETVEVEDFCEDRWQECSAGIHFFITRDEAVNYC